MEICQKVLPNESVDEVKESISDDIETVHLSVKLRYLLVMILKQWRNSMAPKDLFFLYLFIRLKMVGLTPMNVYVTNSVVNKSICCLTF